MFGLTIVRAARLKELEETEWKHTRMLEARHWLSQFSWFLDPLWEHIETGEWHFKTRYAWSAAPLRAEMEERMKKHDERQRRLIGIIPQ